MDQQYKNAQRRAEDLEHKVSDLIDDATHPHARALTSVAKQIVDQLKNKHNPRSIEDKIKSKMQFLQQIRSQGEQVMNYPDIDFLHKNYEQLMQQMRQFDNY